MLYVCALQVGDPVVICDVNFGDRRSKVAKVGRVNIFVGKDKRAYDKMTGRVKDGYGHSHLETVEAYERRCMRASNEEELRKHGIEARGSQLTDEQIGRLVVALKEIVEGEHSE